MKPHALHPEADQEYAEAAQHYAAISPELGGRFFDIWILAVMPLHREPNYWVHRLG